MSWAGIKSYDYSARAGSAFAAGLATKLSSRSPDSVNRILSDSASYIGKTAYSVGKGVGARVHLDWLVDSNGLSKKQMNNHGPSSSHTVEGVEWNRDMIMWDTRHGLIDSMSEDFFLSKAFSESMQPSKVIPYYLRAETDFDPNDITITTLVTSNRFAVFDRLVSHYQGPVSVTIHVTNNPQTRAKLLEELHTMYTSNPYMKKYVDVHLVVDTFDRQFNMWRNVARFFARTDYVMMLDVDFHLCTNFRKHILESPVLMEQLSTGKGAVVIPAFEYIAQEDGIDAKTFPVHKDGLVNEVKAGKLDMFHRGWQPGHGSTNYTRFYAAAEPYKITSYSYSYEPYVVFKKEGSPWCDERFIGYGGNKAACLYEIFITGIDYWILPNDFLIHQSHAYAEDTRKHERRYNRKVYESFREEICFRYTRAFLAGGEFDTERANNLKAECGKIRGFKTAMAKLQRSGV